MYIYRKRVYSENEDTHTYIYFVWIPIKDMNQLNEKESISELCATDMCVCPCIQVCVYMCVARQKISSHKEAVSVYPKHLFKHCS